MAEDEEKQSAEKDEVKKRKLPVKIIVMAVVGVLIFGGAAFALKEGLLQRVLGSGQQEPAASRGQKKQTKQNMGPIYSLDAFLVNLMEPMGKRYLKAKIELELDSEKLKPEMDMRLPQVRDAILTMLSSKSYEDINDLSGKFQLRADIISILNGYLKTGKIENVYFTEFIVQ